MDLLPFIGLPFKAYGRDWEGVDCWGLCYLWHKENTGLLLPQYPFAPNTEAASEAIEGATSPGTCWAKVGVPGAGNIAVFGLYGRPAHVGLVLDPYRMLHIEEGINSAVESMHGIRWGKRLLGTYEYVG